MVAIVNARGFAVVAGIAASACVARPHAPGPAAAQAVQDHPVAELTPLAKSESAQPPASPLLPSPSRRVATAVDRLEGYFPNFVMTTHDGREVRFYDDLLKDKVVVIQFLYTECGGICPSTTATLIETQKMLGDRVGRDVFFYSITLDPERDTPDVLRRYVEEHGIRPGWLLLTGKPDEIDALRRKFGLYDPDPVIDADKSQHAGLLIYGNEAVGRWGTVPSLDSPKNIVRSLAKVLGQPRASGK